MGGPPMREIPCIHRPPTGCVICGYRGWLEARGVGENRKARWYDLACASCGQVYRVIYRRPRRRTSVEVLA